MSSKDPVAKAQPESQTAGIAQKLKEEQMAEAAAAAKAKASQDASKTAAETVDAYKDNLRGDRREKQAKLDKKFKPEKARKAHMWLSELVNGKGIDNKIKECLKEEVKKIMHDDLMNGVVLCRAMEKLFPAEVKKMGKTWKVKKSTQAFVCRSQIQNFCVASKNIGMKNTEIMDTMDLFEGRNMNNVVNHLYALNALAMKAGSKILIEGGHKISEASKREWTEEELKKQREANSVPLLCQTKDAGDASNFDSYGIVKSQAKASGAVPLMASGIPKQDGGQTFDSYGIVKSQDKASAAVPKLASGIPKQEDNKAQDGIIKSVLGACAPKDGTE